MNRSQLRTVNLIIAALLLFNVSFGRENVDVDGTSSSGGTETGTTTTGGNKTPTNCLLGSSKIELDINNVRALMLNAGDMWWDQGGTSNARYEIPKVDDPTKVKKHSLFAGAIWIGGVDPTNNVLVTAETYRQGGSQSFFPGPIVDEAVLDISAEECVEWDRHFKVDRDVIDKFVSDFEDGAITDVDQIPEEILLWAAKNNPYLAGDITTLDRTLAPFVDINGDDVYDPMAGDYPNILGDQAVWWILNDVGGDKNLGDGTVTDAIGLEISTMAFAFATDNLINNQTFYKNIVENKGSVILQNTYLGQWVDADLGNFDDDYVGCDVARGLGICYNGKPVDEGFRGYGENPPAVGVDFFRGPLADDNDGIDNDHDCEVDEEGETIVMSKFMYYNNNSSLVNGNPNRKIDYYNYLRNIWRDGQIITYDGGNGLDQNASSANYMFPFDTDIQTGWGFGGNCANPSTGGENVYWDENTAGNDPADRRFLQSAGPFTLQPGAVNEVTIGVVWCRAGSGGPTGSLSCLKIADDMAQALFDRDFEILNGPNAPDLKVVELDQEVVLTMIPDTFTIDGAEFNTESYEEVDKKLQSLGAVDPKYRFQGYKIYQLSGPDVSVAEIENVDRARLIAQCDEADGVSKLINTINDPDLEAFVPELAINGSDDGIFHTLNIKQDAFTSATLVNYQTYYFMAIAYGYNLDEKNDIVNSDGQQYLPGRKNVQTYAAMPHKVDFRNGGTVLNAEYGSGLDVTRVSGVGNGGNNLALTDEAETEILTNYSMDQPIYDGSGAPVYVKVYDPISVQNGDFRLKLFSRLVYTADSVSALFAVGDTIQALQSSINLPIFQEQGDSAYISKVGDLPQTAGRAVIREILEVENIDYEVIVFDTGAIGNERRFDTSATFRVAKIEMLNSYDGGTFMFDYKRIQESSTVDDGGNTTAEFVRYDYLPYTFQNEANTSIQAEAFEFELNDYWELYDLTNQTTIDSTNTIRGDKRVSEFNEQILPEYGIALELDGVKDPLFRVIENTDNGFLSAEIVYGANGTGNAWIGEPELDDNESDDYDPWMALYRDVPIDETTIDPAGIYRQVLGGSWTTYALVKTIPAVEGAAYIQGKELSKIYNLGNVDIVITEDQSKWSKCIVLQFDKSGVSPSTGLLRSPVKNGSNQTGIGDFPGYAIDLDRGVRLNIMFSESATEDTVNGNDLSWDPTKDANGSRSYIYVTDTKYDEGANYTALFDSIEANTTPGTVNARNGYSNAIFSDFTWVGNIKVSKSSGFMASDVTRIKLRVNKQYRAGADNLEPEYEFSTSGVLAETNNLSLADSVLSLVRMVPNPYYAYSNYESFQFDNRVKMTNLPQVCTIRIFNSNGELIRVYDKSSDATFIDWDLRNQTGIPIAGGVYFVHIMAPELNSEVVVKWFGILRPFDLDTF